MSLRGTPIDNDGFVHVGDIETDGNGLLCLTNNTNCCGPDDPGPTTGDWYFPSRSVVRSFTFNSNARRTNFYYRNRALSAVRLNRFNDPSERGRFRCELLNSTIYANICELYSYIRQ